MHPARVVCNLGGTAIASTYPMQNTIQSAHDFAPDTVKFTAAGAGFRGDCDFSLSGPLPAATVRAVEAFARKRGVPAAHVFLCLLREAQRSMLDKGADPDVQETIARGARVWTE